MCIIHMYAVYISSVSHKNFPCKKFQNLFLELRVSCSNIKKKNMWCVTKLKILNDYMY